MMFTILSALGTNVAWIVYLVMDDDRNLAYLNVFVFIAFRSSMF